MLNYSNIKVGKWDLTDLVDDSLTTKSDRLVENIKRKVKEFEEHFLMEMENKLPDVLSEFKNGLLPDSGVKRMVDLANELIPQYKK